MFRLLHTYHSSTKGFPSDNVHACCCNKGHMCVQTTPTCHTACCRAAYHKFPTVGRLQHRKKTCPEYICMRLHRCRCCDVFLKVLTTWAHDILAVASAWQGNRQLATGWRQLGFVRAARRKTHLQRRRAEPSQDLFRLTQKSHVLFNSILQGPLWCMRESTRLWRLSFVLAANPVEVNQDLVVVQNNKG